MIPDMFTDASSRRRVRRLVTKFASSPVLPALGWTKVAETIVAGGPTLNWIAYTILVTTVWVIADEIREAADWLNDAVDF